MTTFYPYTTTTWHSETREPEPADRAKAEQLTPGEWYSPTRRLSLTITAVEPGRIVGKIGGDHRTRPPRRFSLDHRMTCAMLATLEPVNVPQHRDS